MRTTTNRIILAVATVTLAVIVVAIAWIALWGVLVIIAGILFGVFLNRLARLVSDHSSLSYTFAFALIVVLLLAIIGASFYALGNQLVERVDDFLQQFKQAREDITLRIENNRWWNALTQYLPEHKAAASTTAIDTAKSAASGVLTVLGGGLFVLFLGFYFALQPIKYRDGFLMLLSGESKEVAKDAIPRCVEALWLWMIGRMIGMAVIGGASALGLWLIGIPMPITLGVLAGLLNFIPNLGPFISVVPPLLFGLQQGGNAALYVAALYLLLQFLESYFLTPLITQHQVSLAPGLTLSVQLVLGLVAGFLGLVLATPLTVVVTTLLRDVYVPRRPKHTVQ
jgi:predicted PurR-regulated permease PerM